MTVLTRGQMRSLARNMALDASSTNVQVLDAELNSMIDEISHFVWNFFGPRYTYIIAGAAGSGFVQDLLIAIASAGEYRITTNDTNIDEIVSVHFEGASSLTMDGPMLERTDYTGILELRRGSTTPGVPKYVHWERIATPSNAAAPSKWLVMVHPPPAGASGGNPQYISIRGRLEMTAYAGDGSQPDVTPIESYYIARMLGYELAAAGGRDPSTLDTIASLLPKELRAARGIKLHTEVGVASVDTQ